MAPAVGDVLSWFVQRDRHGAAFGRCHILGRGRRRRAVRRDRRRRSQLPRLFGGHRVRSCRRRPFRRPPGRVLRSRIGGAAPVPRLARCRCSGGRGTALRDGDGLRRTVSRLVCVPLGRREANPRTDSRRDPRQRWAPRLCHDVAGARAGHPPRTGVLECLHERDADGRDCGGPPFLAGPEGTPRGCLGVRESDALHP